MYMQDELYQNLFVFHPVDMIVQVRDVLMQQWFWKPLFGDITFNAFLRRFLMPESILLHSPVSRDFLDSMTACMRH